jgi:hypothetical protein
MIGFPCQFISIPKFMKKPFSVLLRARRFLLFKRTLFPFFLRALRGLLFKGTLLLSVALASAQPLQREWVRNYSNVQTNFNQAIAIAVAPDGNIVVAGTSQNIGGDMDYEIIKYKSNGDQAWAARYGSTNSGNDQLRGMTIDPNGNVIVTGTSDTVKFNPAGSLVWSQPLGGRAIIATTNYVYVTGFSDTDIATTQLTNNTDGVEIWSRVLDGSAHGNDIGQAITLDGSGNVYVGGQEDGGCSGALCYKRFAAVSYTPGGVQRWFNAYHNGYPGSSVQANSIVVRLDGSVDVYGTYKSYTDLAYVVKFSQTEESVWFSTFFGSAGTKMIADRTADRVLGTGNKFNSAANNIFAFVTAFVGTESPADNPVPPIWSCSIPSVGLDLKQDSSGNVYVMGFSDNGAFSTAVFLAKLTTSGQQLGLDRYNSPNAGSNFGTALAIDTNDNVYATGYVLNAQGGSEFVTIKYSVAPKIEKKPGGAMHLEFHTTPGRQYAIESTTNFFNWQSLITNTADANGLIQFDDLNAPTIPYRFYRGNSAP